MLGIMNGQRRIATKQYFVTGATGSLASGSGTLLPRLGSVVHFLVRPGSESKLDALYEYWAFGSYVP
ncbi:MAG TPA: hypothetical protein VEZ89_09785 [Rubrivivax sp.]|nr:hypothetical protein [Rubrivivax sp.]